LFRIGEDNATVIFPRNHGLSPTTQVIGLGSQGQDILDMIAVGCVADRVVVHPYDDGSGIPEIVYEKYNRAAPKGNGVDYAAWVTRFKAAIAAQL
jgi:hypothetical protein